MAIGSVSGITSDSRINIHKGRAEWEPDEERTGAGLRHHRRRESLDARGRRGTISGCSSGCASRTRCSSRHCGHRTNRRTFLGTLGFGVLAVPLAAEAQQAARVPRVGIVEAGSGAARAGSLDHPVRAEQE